MLLSDLVDEYAAASKGNGYARNTVRLRVNAARTFLAIVGNIRTANVTSQHADAYFAARYAKGISPVTLNNELSLLKDFWRYAARRGFTKRDIFEHRRLYRVMPADRVRVPATKFGHLLDSCPHPVDRMVVALGLYLMLRQSEIVDLRIADVNLETGYIRARIHKSSAVDDMPICAELDRELRRWLTWYTEHMQAPLDPLWYLVPAKTAPQFAGRGKATHEHVRLKPMQRIAHPEQVVQRALRASGYTTTADGKTTREGVHTLRRSSARAMFDRLVEDGHDQALRVVQSALHHQSQTTTERYLGVEIDKRRRDELIRGREMFPADTSNVHEITRKAEG